MYKHAIAVSLITLLSAGAAQADNCPANPYTLTNGTSADASQVMADFNNLLNCSNNILAPTANPNLTGLVAIGSPNAGAESLTVGGTVALGNVPEKLSLNSGSIGFNRRVTTGQIYNTSAYAYQMQHIANSGAGSDYLQFQTYSPTGSSGPKPLTLDALGRVAVNGSTTNTNYTFFVNGTSGGLGNWINASDGRLKKNVTQISGALDLVQHLRGVRFYWRPADERSIGASLPLPINEPQLGFIAQEVEKVVPEAVVKPTKATGSIYGLNQESLIPILVEAIKEQQVEIEQLRTSLAALSPTRQH